MMEYSHVHTEPSPSLFVHLVWLAGPSSSNRFPAATCSWWWWTTSVTAACLSQSPWTPSRSCISLTGQRLFWQKVFAWGPQICRFWCPSAFVHDSRWWFERSADAFARYGKMCEATIKIKISWLWWTTQSKGDKPACVPNTSISFIQSL